MTTLDNRPNAALLVIDVQNSVVAGAARRDQVVANIGRLVDQARTQQVPVVWVQDSLDGQTGSDAWEIVPELSPDASEPLIHKQYGDSFEATELEPVLSGLGIGRLIVVGEQVISHTNMYWGAQTAPGRTAGTVETADVSFSG